MRSVMRALVLIGLPGAIFAPLITQVHAGSFCGGSWSQADLQLFQNDLPPCPTLPSTATIVLIAIAAAVVAVAWGLAPLYVSPARSVVLRRPRVPPH